MSTYEERMARYEEQLARSNKFTRTIRTTITYLKKAEHWLYNNPPNMTEYWRLLDVVIDTATEIVERLPDNFFESEEVEDYFGLRASLEETLGPFPSTLNLSDGPLEAAKKLVELIEKRRERGNLLSRIMRLEAVKGRTPEETASYLDKAKELREKLSGV